MTKLELVKVIHKKTGLSKEDITLTLEETMKTIRKYVASGQNVYLRGFGSFVVKKRPKTNGRDIKRNVRIEIPAQHVPVFKPSPYFKDAVKRLPIDEE